GGRDVYLLGVWIVSRCVSVLLGTWSVYLTYRFTARLFDPTAGLVAAAFLSVSFYHCLHSPLAALDVPLSFLLLVNCLLALRAIETDRVRDFAWLGIASGFLLGTKIVAVVFFLVPLLLIAFRNYPKSPKNWAHD